MIGFTTQEKLKHMYDRFYQSPFAFSSCFSEWAKVVFCPQSIQSRITHELDLKSNKQDEFETLIKSQGEKSLPTEMQEHSVVLYKEAFEVTRVAEPFIGETGHQRQDTLKGEKVF